MTDDFSYSWHLGLFNSEGSLATLPEFNAPTFAAFLGKGRFGYNFVREGRRTGVLAPDSVSYSGPVSLVDGPSPVPEPMSLLLVGSGVGGIGVRAWRRKRRVNR